MKALILSSALALAEVVGAQDVVIRNGQNVLRLSDAPCTHPETLAQILPEWRQKFRRAHSVIRGRDQFACWIATPSGTVHVVWEDGDEGDFPISEFKRDEGV